MYQYYRWAWQHPCEDTFSAVASLWYTRWIGMTYDECTNKEHAGVWRSVPNSAVKNPVCLVFFGAREHWPTPRPKDTNKDGWCFVLDKVPVHQRCGSASLLLL
jgi:hypothetical protein